MTSLLCSNGPEQPRAAAPRPPGSVAQRERLERLGSGPLSFWFLNHELEKAELKRQLEELKAKGFSGVFMHPRGGLLEPYGSCHWYEAVGFCIAEARRIGLEAWLYDEDPYPSGAAGGRVLFENPALQASCLDHRLLEVHEPGRHILDLPAGPLVGAYLVQGGTITSIEKYAGIVRTDWSQYYTSDSYHPVYREEGCPHWRAGTGDPHYRIVIDLAEVAVPTCIIGFTRSYSPQYPWGGYPDPLNLKSIEAFTRYTHDEYAEHFGDEFGKVVPGVFTDEFKLYGKLPWTDAIDSLFFKVCNRDLMEVLPHLVMTVSSDTPFIRWAYRETLARTFLAHFARPLHKCCESHNLLFTGHISPEEAPLSQAVMTPGYMRVLAEFDIPGTDFIGHTVGAERRPLYHLSPKLASSVAHAASRPLVLCEAFAVADWTQDFDFLTKVTNWLFALGVNRIVTHGQFYSIDGLRKREAPPSQFFQASYWEHFQAYSRSITFLTGQLTQGEHQAPVLVYYPEESFMTLSFEEKGALPGEGLRLQEEFGRLIGSLLAHGFDFDLADFSNLLKATADEGVLTLAGESFQAIVVPGAHLREETWEILQHLEQKGVPVCFVEREITVLTPALRKVRVDTCPLEDLPDYLSRHATPVWRHPSGALIGHKRATPDGPILFLCNTGAEEVHGPVELDFPGPYEVCAYTNGTQWASAGRAVHLDLAPGQGVLIRRSRSHPAPVHVPRRDWRPLVTEWLDWSAAPQAENCLVLHQFRIISRPHQAGGIRLPEAGDFTMAPIIDLLAPTLLSCQPPAPAEDRFYRAAFDWQGPPTALRLVHDTELSLPLPSLGGAPVEFFLNDTSVGPSERRHTYDPMNREVDLTPLVRAGRNTLLWLQKGAPVSHLPWPYDAVRIFGDFHIDFPHGSYSPPTLRSRPREYACGSPVSPTQLGHPHYNGLFSYHAAFQIARLPKRIALRFQGVHETMNVRVNGFDCGHLWTAPYLLEIDAGHLRPGVNTLTLHCSTSPANYLQVMNRPAGPFGRIEWCEV